ncbi:oxidoreductase domain-containing protein [Salinarchaeum sp. Harcht-Bsk1]|uniref:Gfo/Idh/MocA family protein n=1 Tax=Salinarchaeum sp. Harcht-Bsk1 TaxID=1333523 RepID=UPI0003424054|nr:Gfo/Idh/MocA family oxidoreductase [Salinarchaeum sp. Harcht-Bsk1]AGN02203.1 oxidoreductase domain-containing protein [Salinarchaeum sp. Harcht-Bsk1]
MSDLSAGVIGVGSMGRHHARVYHELRDVDLDGVYDVDRERADSIADDYDTEAHDLQSLLETVDLVSIVVPTEYHADLARSAIDAGTALLVEKPIVKDVETGRELVRSAREQDVTLQVGHVERFNPAVRALPDVLADSDVIAVEARRIGPPFDRERGVTSGVVYDLMIHDLDVVRSILDVQAQDVDARAAADGEYVTATVQYDDEVVGTFTASRVTQKKVRELSITTEDSVITVDYMEQSVKINRRSLPEYVETDGDLRYRRENVVERPTVENGEPLKRELSGFVDAVRNGADPVVTGEEGLAVLRTVERIAGAAGRGP